jgi:hypothetical protein
MSPFMNRPHTCSTYVVILLFVAYIHWKKIYIVIWRLLILTFVEHVGKGKTAIRRREEEEERKSAKYDDDDVIMSSSFFSAYYFFSCLYRTFVTLTDCIRYSSSYFDRFVLSWERREREMSNIEELLLSLDYWTMIFLLFALDSLRKICKALYCKIR